MKEYIVNLTDISEYGRRMIIGNGIPKEELIRCKDCQYWMKSPYRESSVFGLCFKHKDIAIASDETNWCSWAERRTDEQTD